MIDADNPSPETAAEQHSSDLNTLCTQFEAVRRTGATNMLDARGVRDAAEQIGFDELAEFVRASTSEEYAAVLKEMGRRRE
jgi:hypothetical protein